MANHVESEIKSLRIQVEQLENIKKEKERQLVQNLHKINLIEELLHLVKVDKTKQQQQQKNNGKFF